MLNVTKLRQRISELEEAGQTQEVLAQKAGMSKSQWSNILRGHQSPDIRLSTLDKIAKAVGLDPCDLLK